MNARRATASVLFAAGTVGFMALTSPRPAQTQSPTTDVRVVNTSGSPVPTTVVNAPVVKAQQSGTWGVHVINPAASPVRVRPTQETGLVVMQNMPLSIADASTVGQAQFTIPFLGSQILVIDHVSLRLLLPNGQKITNAFVQTGRDTGTGDVVLQPNFLPVQFLASAGGSDVFVASQQTTIYHDAYFQKVRVVVERATSGGTCTGSVTLQGRIRNNL